MEKRKQDSWEIVLFGVSESEMTKNIGWLV